MMNHPLERSRNNSGASSRAPPVLDSVSRASSSLRSPWYTARMPLQLRAHLKRCAKLLLLPILIGSISVPISGCSGLGLTKLPDGYLRVLVKDAGVRADFPQGRVREYRDSQDGSTWEVSEFWRASGAEDYRLIEMELRKDAATLAGWRSSHRESDGWKLGEVVAQTICGMPAERQEAVLEPEPVRVYLMDGRHGPGYHENRTRASRLSVALAFRQRGIPVLVSYSIELGQRSAHAADEQRLFTSLSCFEVK